MTQDSASKEAAPAGEIIVEAFVHPTVGVMTISRVPGYLAVADRDAANGCRIEQFRLCPLTSPAPAQAPTDDFDDSAKPVVVRVRKSEPSSAVKASGLETAWQEWSAGTDLRDADRSNFEAGYHAAKSEPRAPVRSLAKFNRYCRAQMCLESDKEHEPECPRAASTTQPPATKPKEPA